MQDIITENDTHLRLYSRTLRSVPLYLPSSTMSLCALSDLSASILWSPSVVVQRSSSKSLGQSKPNFIRSFNARLYK